MCIYSPDMQIAMNHYDKADNIESFPIAQRYLRQLLLIRYERLLKAIEEKFPVTSTQKDQLEKRILNVEWVDMAFHDE